MGGAAGDAEVQGNAPIKVVPLTLLEAVSKAATLAEIVSSSASGIGSSSLARLSSTVRRAASMATIANEMATQSAAIAAELAGEAPTEPDPDNANSGMRSHERIPLRSA